MNQKGNDTITLPFNPTDDRLIDAVIVIKEVFKHFDLSEDEQMIVIEFCKPKNLIGV